MSTEKIFPVDYSEIETKLYIQELTNKLDNSALPQGEKHNLESKIMLCQNHLMSLSIIESNNKLNERNENLKNNQTTLSKIWTDFISAEKKASKQAKIIIGLTLLTLVATMIVEVYHIREENENQKEIIRQLVESNKNIQDEAKEIYNSINNLIKADTIKINRLKNEIGKHFKN